MCQFYSIASFDVNSDCITLHFVVIAVFQNSNQVFNFLVYNIDIQKQIIS